ncbi:MAG: dihydropteroate synthase [Actinomycetota bacterium]|nr:dihydropteroate synthase [Actinomycetota bacterium]
MGVLNVTPDSFSDGGRYLAQGAAVAHGLALHRDGADLVDVGGESTRPGAGPVDEVEEARRVVPVVAELVAQGVAVSVDTMHSTVARAALEVGARVVNDVSGGLADPLMARVVAEAGVPWVLMHWRAGPGFTHTGVPGVGAGYEDVVAEVREELIRRVDAAVMSGVDPAALVIDPGLGFAKNAGHNWALLRTLRALTDLGFPVLVGASRKRFLGSLLAEADGSARPVQGREVATAVVSALAAINGAWGVRVHDVAASMDAVAVSTAWTLGTSPAAREPGR